MQIVGLVILGLVGIFFVHNAFELVRLYRRKRKERREQSSGNPPTEN